ncbi:MAG: molybdopterin molybdotransferase MoeA [Pseudomonadota bacterium]|nr:MAG: molybdopterin molybdenumtransferase MoeA [Pseudomonadota bacterium]
MLSFEEARARLLGACAVLESERVPLAEAVGRVLAEDLRTQNPLPPYDHSAMDGYALRFADLASEPPYELPVIGESRAGDAFSQHVPGSACRIFTGAPLPAGADTVVIQENVVRTADRIRLSARPGPNENVRRAGEDLAAGAVALSAGTRLGPFQLGLAAALDRDSVLVRRQPRVVVLPTGSELRPAGSPGPAGTIPESNGVVIAALATRAGARATLEAAIPDAMETAAERFRRALDHCDVLVTVGGASVGDHDVVRPALESSGVAIEFWKVAIQPGKPFAFGRRNQTLVLGLPGNPVSAQVTFALFGMPVLRALQGDAAPLPPLVRVVLAEPIRRKPGRLGILRARLVEGRAHLAANQASGATTSLAANDVLVLAPADRSELPAGTELGAIRLSDL